MKLSGMRRCSECRGDHAADELCPVFVVSCDSLGGEKAAGASPWPVGERFGSYRVERLIGEGAMGTVYLARHDVLQTTVAAKVLRPKLAKNPAILERFMAEARALSLVGHENIVKVFDLGEASGLHYILMEHVDGELLSAMDTPMAPALAVSILAEVCRALDAAHRIGVAHMDVKPANVFVVRRGRSVRVKVLDFGAARLLSDASGVRAVVGTPQFMSPEQWNREPVDGRSDLYSLGVTGYRMVTGRLPFLGDVRAQYLAHRTEAPVPPHRVHPGVPPALSEVLLKAMAKRREERFASANEMAEALRRALRRHRRQVRTASHDPNQPPYVSSSLDFLETWSGASTESTNALKVSWEGAFSGYSTSSADAPDGKPRMRVIDGGKSAAALKRKARRK